jgi:uncharacterized membrane protein YoaK (UPF0700 family)
VAHPPPHGAAGAGVKIPIVTGSASGSGPSAGWALKRAVFDERHGPLPALLLSLTVLAGVVDAVSILSLGHVFVATMTGNLVFIGLAAAGAKGFSVAASALAIGGFVIGVLIGARACRAAGSHRGRALRNVLALKLGLASVVTLIALLSDERYPAGARDAMVVLLATSMGAQLAAIRHLKVPDLLTVVLTMTIAGALTDRPSGWNDARLLRRALSVLAFAIGALSGALLVLHVGTAAALGLGLAIIVATTVAAHLVSRAPSGWSAVA